MAVNGCLIFKGGKWQKRSTNALEHSESFVDQEASKRFYEIVMALWRAQGDPTALSDTVLTEFALKRSAS